MMVGSKYYFGIALAKLSQFCSHVNKNHPIIRLKSYCCETIIEGLPCWDDSLFLGRRRFQRGINAITQCINSINVLIASQEVSSTFETNRREIVWSCNFKTNLRKKGDLHLC